MVPGRALLRALGLSLTVGVTGCNALDDGVDETSSRTGTSTATPTATPTRTLSPTTDGESTTPNPTKTSTPTRTDTPTPTPTPAPTPTVAEAVGTPALAPASDDVDEFGRAVALSNEAAVVVAESYGAYVFEKDDGWSRTTVLTPDDDENFGGHNVSAALVGEGAIVGGPGAGAGDGIGAAYLFERAGDGWRQRHRFTSGEDTDEFGRAVAFDGDRVVVGDAQDPTTMVTWVGGAYVFGAEGADWTREAHLGTDAQDLFGTSVAVDDDTVLVGAPYAEPVDERTGAVYGYEPADGEWRRRTTLVPDDSTDDALFGQSVALDGDTAVVGAPGDGGGSAYVFERTDGEWTRRARVTAPGDDSGGDFGRSVASTGAMAVVGAPDAARSGRAYAFGAADDWTGARRLVATAPHEDAEFGFAVALFDGTALVGSPVLSATSPAYLFEL
jgi:hypothetical protein